MRELRAGTADRDAIERIVRSVGFFGEEEVAVALEIVDVALEERATRALDPKTGYLFTIAEQSSRVVGYACYGRTPMTDGVYDLYWIVVDKALQGAGIGKALLRELEHRLRSYGARLVMLETESAPAYDATRRFYLAAGYQELARLRDFYRVGSDKVMYGRWLKEGA